MSRYQPANDPFIRIVVLTEVEESVAISPVDTEVAAGKDLEPRSGPQARMPLLSEEAASDFERHGRWG